MSTQLDLDEYLNQVESRLSLIKNELAKFGPTKIPQGVEEGIKLWSLMAVKMALELLSEAAANSKRHEEFSNDEVLGDSEDSTVEGKRERLSIGGGIQQRERKRDGKGGD